MKHIVDLGLEDIFMSYQRFSGEQPTLLLALAHTEGRVRR